MNVNEINDSAHGGGIVLAIMFAQVRREALDQHERCAGVDDHVLIERFTGDAEVGIGRFEHAGIIDQSVNPAEVFEQGVGDLIGRVGFFKIGMDDLATSTHRFDVALQTEGIGFAVAIGDGNVHVGIAGQCQCDGASDADGPAGDECGFIFSRGGRHDQDQNRSRGQDRFRGRIQNRGRQDRWGVRGRLNRLSYGLIVTLRLARHR